MKSVIFNIVRSFLPVVTTTTLLVASLLVLSTHAAECNLWCHDCGGVIDSSAIFPGGGRCGDEIASLAIDEADIECQNVKSRLCPTPCCRDGSFTTPGNDLDDDEGFAQQCIPFAQTFNQCYARNLAECGRCDNVDDDGVFNPVDPCGTAYFARICAEQATCCPTCYGQFKEMLKCNNEAFGCSNSHCDNVSGSGAGGGGGGGGTSGSLPIQTGIFLYGIVAVIFVGMTM